ncbi:MAG: DUF6982 domain-containing protein [Actinomycetota bacterium]
MDKVVARYLDGRLVKGISFDVSFAKPVCHVTTPDQGVVKVTLADLKALFFVRDLVGNKDYQESKTVAPSDPRARGARQLEIRFRDGEVIVALAAGYSDERPFFFVVPADPKSNATRILVNRAAVEAVK